MRVGVRSRRSRMLSDGLAYTSLAPFLIFALFPFYFMFVTSFKRNAELYNLKSVPFWIQAGVITDNYTYLFGKTEFLTWMKNSLVISVMATTVSVVIAILAGYSLARLRFRGVGSFFEDEDQRIVISMGVYMGGRPAVGFIGFNVGAVK